eukprot:m.91176 g.91176  ORF g.91176 m.91176 type:complete len:1069 (+) comp13291_c0_seq1:245-3451(+)
MNSFLSLGSHLPDEPSVDDDPLVHACMSRNAGLIHRHNANILELYNSEEHFTEYKAQGLSKHQVVEREVNRKDSHSRTPLHAAAFMCDSACCKALLEARASPGAKDKNWVTPLHWACCMGSVNVATLLLQHSSDFFALNSVDRETRQSPLHIAAGHGHDKVCELLIDHLRGSVEGSKLLTQVNLSDRRGRTPLHLSAYNGYVSVIKCLIGKSCQVDKRDKGGRTALHWAAYRGHYNATMELLKSEALVQAIDHADNQGCTALHAGAISGSTMVVEALMKGGASLMARDGRGRSSIHLAVMGGKFECTKLLLQMEPDTSATDNLGQTALHKAVLAEEPDAEMVELLLHYGFDPAHRDAKGRTALHLACKRGNLETIYLLIQAWNQGVNVADNVGNSCIHFAARYGHAPVIEFLFSNDTHINARGQNGMTALHISSLFGFVDCIRFLLDSGVNVNALDSNGRTALHAAAFRGVTESVSLLLEHKIRSKLLDRQGRTALHYAAASNVAPTCELVMAQLPVRIRFHADSFGRTPLHYAAAVADRSACLQALLNAGASVMVFDKNQLTPIHVICMHGHTRSLERLFDSMPLSTVKQCVNSVDASKRTPLHYAAHGGYSGVVEVLLRVEGTMIENRDLYQRTPLALAAASGSCQCMQLLMEAGASCNTKDITGQTPIMTAAIHSSIDCIRVLLETPDPDEDEPEEDKFAPADTTVVDNNKRTVLMHAVASGCIECVSILLETGNMDVNAVDKQGQTALVIALRYSETMEIDNLNEIIEGLVKAGAQLDSRDLHGRTALHVAAIYGCEDAVRGFMEQGCKANELDSYNRTPLHYACYHGHEQCAASFLDEEIEWQNPNENTFGALHCAACRGHSNCLDSLFEEASESLDVNARDEYGRAAVHLAAMGGHQDCVRVLEVADDIDINIKDPKEKTALVYAAERGHHEASACLIEFGADFTEAVYGQSILHLTYAENSPLGGVAVLEAVINRLQSEGASRDSIAQFLDAKSSLGDNILLLACGKHDVETVRCLQDHGARTDVADAQGWSPLHRLIPSDEGRRCLDLLINNLEVADVDV